MGFCSLKRPSLTRQERGGCAGLLRCGKGTTWEGGMRVPALFKWDGVIPKAKSNQLFTALDIVPSIMSMVGHPVSGLHGLDLSKTLVLGQKSKRTIFAYFAEAPVGNASIMALRWHHFKAHFYTQGNSLSDDANFDLACTSKAKLTFHDPPLLFDLNVDPGERYPLFGGNDRYAHIIRLMSELKIELETSVEWAESEMSKGVSQSAFPCCSKDVFCKPFPTCCNCFSQS